MPYKDKQGNVKVVDITISGGPSIIEQNNGILSYTPADKLIHEMVGHAVPLVGGTADSGNAVENENVVRGQRDMTQRDVVDDPSK